MQIPKAGWALYNVFRLVAIVFMTWALVAQFVAVAQDLKAYSEASGGDIPATATSAAATRSTITHSTTSPSAERLITATPTRSLTTTSSARTTSTSLRREPLTRVVDDTDTTAATRPTALITASRVVPAADTDALIVPIRKRDQRERAEGAEISTGTYGAGSIPTSPGGVLFAIASRLIMVTALGFLLLAQLGVPESWLHRKTPMFGPQSTPLWLGVGQSVIAVENLRIYSANVVWTAHAGLLVIGMINAHLGLILLFLANRRRLPADPPPPLYFSRLTRLFYFRPAPPFYAGLLAEDGNQRWGEMKPASGRPRGLRVEVDDPEMGVMRDEAHTDVRRGGYPTFARGGLGHPGPQIPVGPVDATRRGHANGFIARPPPPPSLDARSVETGDAYSGVADDESRVDARDLAERNASKDSLTSNRSLKGKRKPAPLGLERSNAEATRMERQQAERERDMAALREKLSGRLERKGSADTAISKAAIGPPSLQRTTSDQVTSARTVLIGKDGGPQAGGSSDLEPVLPSIPKRSNTLDQPSARTPPSRLNETRQAPAPPPKSPVKSVAGSLYSSILPWTKASRPASPTSPKSSRLVQPPLPPLTQVPHPHETANRGITDSDSAQARPRPQRVDALAGVKPSIETPPLSRSESGSRLLKKLKDARSRSPNPIKPPAATSVARADTLPSARPKPSSYGEPNPRQTSMSAAIESDSPLSAMIESVRAKVSEDKQEAPLAPRSPSPPTSPAARPKTAQSTFPNPALRSSISTLARSGSTRSARSAKTAMGVRFDLEKRHSSSDEDLLSPDSQVTATPRSAGFRIPGTKLTIPFPSTPRTRPNSTETVSTPSSDRHSGGRNGLILDAKGPEGATALDTNEIEAARPESVATASSTGSLYQQRGLDAFGDGGQGNKPMTQIKSVAERAGLPKRANTIANDADKMARRSHTVILGGEYIDGGTETGHKKGHRRRPSSMSIDPTRVPAGV